MPIHPIFNPDWDLSTYGEDEIICPYCGYYDDEPESKIYEETYGKELKCPSCNKKYSLDVEITFSYSTEKIEDENPEPSSGEK